MKLKQIKLFYLNYSWETLLSNQVRNLEFKSDQKFFAR